MVDTAGPAEPPPLNGREREQATTIAMHVRNQLEQLHGGGGLLDFRNEGGEDRGLTDEQMRLINPIVRDAVADVLHAIAHADEHVAARSLLAFTAMAVPSYWERPELTREYQEMWRQTGQAGDEH